MEYCLKLRYEGRLADLNRMDAADRSVAGDGAKQIFAALAYAYCFGEVPRNKLTNTKLFYLHAGEDKTGCYELPIIGGILGSAIYDAAKYGFREFAVPAFNAWREGRVFYEPEHVRIEPTLERTDQGNAPIFARDAQKAKLWTDLGQALDGGLARATRPIGRYAGHLDMTLDGQSLGRFDCRHYPTVEEAIEAALIPIRENRDLRRYH